MVGLLWIENLAWKHPPVFGYRSDPPTDLYQWTLYGVQNVVFRPWAWFVDNLVLPNFVSAPRRVRCSESPAGPRAAAVVMLVVQLSVGNSNTLGGDGSTVGIFLAFAVGLLPVGLAKEVPTNESSNRQPKGVSDGSQQPA
jgi:hypothetical protein